MRIAIDSNRLSDFRKGDPRAVQVVREASTIFVPLVVVAEQRAGFLLGSRRLENEKLWTRFVANPRVSILCPDEVTAHFYAELYFELRKKGKPIPTNDIWIAALVLQHDLVLFDRDSDFDSIPRLTRI